jgi:GTP-binding protein
VGSRNSIVDDAPGVTRDRIYFDVEWQNKGFTVIDTGGIIPGDEDDIMVSIFSQAQLACEEADKIIFIVDGKDGLNPIDDDIANILRRSGKKVFIAVNKCDNPESLAMINDFYSLSLGEPIAISALHGSGGVGDLLDLVTEDFEYSEQEEKDDKIRIAIVGRPNAGKSSIVNALLDTKRVIVSDISGTTRDSIDSHIKYNDVDYTLVDTAGIRKKSKVDYGVEKFAVDRAIRSIRDCDVALLVIDGSGELAEQDKRISSIITESGKGIIVAINKWDLIEDKKANTINQYSKKLETIIPFLSYAPKIFISAVTKQRLGQIFDESLKIYNESKKRISTGLLNKVINEAYALNPPTSFKGKRLKIYYTTQVGVQPPSFVFFVNNEELMKDNYKRYLENKLREAFGFYGTPIRLSVRERKEKK